MPITSTNEISAAVNVQFQTLALRTAQDLAVYFTGSTPAEVTTHGNTFTALWRRIENLNPVTAPLAELTGSVSFPTRTADQPTVTDITATVQKFGNFIYLNDEVDLVNVNEMGRVLVKRLAMNAGQSLNRLQRNVLEDNSTAVFGGGATTATGVGGGGIVLADIQVTVNALQNNVAMKFLPMTEGSRNIGTTPIRSSFWGFTHVDTEEDIRGLTGFVPVEQYSSQTGVARGEFGAVGGVRWISTTEASIDADSGATITGTATSEGRSTSGTSYDVYNSIVLGMDAVGSVGFGARHVKNTYQIGDRLPAVQMISKPKGSAGAADPLNELASLGWRSWHAGVVLQGDWIRNIRHTTAKLVP